MVSANIIIDIIGESSKVQFPVHKKWKSRTSWTKRLKKNREAVVKQRQNLLVIYYLCTVSSFLEYCILIGCNFFVQMSLCEITEFAIFFCMKNISKTWCDIQVGPDNFFFYHALQRSHCIIKSPIVKSFTQLEMCLFMSLFNLLVQVNLHSKLVWHFYLHICLK